MVITVTLNPAVDKTLIVPGFAVDAVNRVEEILLDPGGKGINVSKSVQALGGETLCIGILGGDTGSYIRQALDEMKLKHDMVLSHCPTRTNTKIVDLKLGTNTDINEAGAPITEQLLDSVWEKLCAAAKAGDTVVIAGRNPPGTPDVLLARWTRQLCQKGVRVCLDTVGLPMTLAVQERPSVIKPNREELSAFTGKIFADDIEVLAAAKELVDSGIDLVAVSLGADGAIFAAKEKCCRSRCPKVTAVSTVGAGDAMMAALAYCIEKNCVLEETARIATAVATATVQVSGSQPAPRELVEKMLALIEVEEI